MDVIVGKNFPDKVIPLIDSATQSIKVVVFDWRWYPSDVANPVQLFNQSIIRAVRRGVKVQVIVNSIDVVRFLRSQGCEVKHGVSQNLVHAKMVIFDDKHVVMGSHNYTQNAFTQNHEISVLLPDCSQAQDFIAFFNSLFNL